MRKVISSALVSLFCFSFIFATNSSLIAAFGNTDNVLEKRNILREIGNTTTERGDAVSSDVKNFLQRTLQEKKATVVETAVYQIGKLNLKSFNPELIYLFRNCDSRFENIYANRVKISIIKTLSNTGMGDKSVFNFFVELLDPSKTKFAYWQNDVLTAIKLSGNTNYVPVVKKYKEFLSNGIKSIKSRDDNIVRYQVLLDHSALCDDIIFGRKSK